MTKKEIINAVKENKLTPTQALAELKKLEIVEKKSSRRPPKFKVAEKSGWCSVYFDGLRRPITVPAMLWLELLEPENLENLKNFLKENERLFRNKG